jgi:uncharacterized protein with PIN domain
MTTRRVAPAPADLGPAGRAAWRALHGKYTFDAVETASVVAYVRQVDAVARLEALVEAEGQMVPGSTGQMRLHPAIAEARAGRLAASKLLDALRLPVEAEATAKAMSSTSKRASIASNARWGRVRAEQESGARPAATPKGRTGA